LISMLLFNLSKLLFIYKKFKFKFWTKTSFSLSFTSNACLKSFIIVLYSTIFYVRSLSSSSLIA
jgi:hypothetical protein